MPKILVTGSDGFVGRNLTPVLARQPGTTVYSYDIRDGNDITDLGQLHAAAQGMDVVIHLAGLTDTRADETLRGRYEAVNVGGTKTVVEVGRSTGAKVVYMSTCDLYPSSLEPLPEHETLAPKPTVYAQSKYQAERYVTEAAKDGADMVVLRLFNPYGPHQSPNRLIYQFLLAALREEPLKVYGDGTTPLDYVYVGDVATAVAHATRFPAGSIVNVATGTGMTVLDIAKLVTAKYGGHIVHVATPREVEVRQLVGSPQRLEELCAWHPLTVAAGIDKTMTWLRETL